MEVMDNVKVFLNVMDNTILKAIYRIVSELSNPFNIYVMKNIFRPQLYADNDKVAFNRILSRKSHNAFWKGPQWKHLGISVHYFANGVLSSMIIVIVGQTLKT